MCPEHKGVLTAGVGGSITESSCWCLFPNRTPWAHACLHPSPGLRDQTLCPRLWRGRSADDMGDRGSDLCTRAPTSATPTLRFRPRTGVPALGSRAIHQALSEWRGRAAWSHGEPLSFLLAVSGGTRCERLEVGSLPGPPKGPSKSGTPQKGAWGRPHPSLAGHR